jgi:hypothetical protein
VIADIDWPSWIQAGSALLIAILTGVLVFATKQYVDKTNDLVEQAKRSNCMVLDSTRRLLRAQAPRLTVDPNSQPAVDAGGSTVNYTVRNVGPSTAHNIVLIFDKGEARMGRPLEAGHEGLTTLRWQGDGVPTIREVTFMDPGGTRWTQRSHQFGLNELPELAD